MFNKVEIKAKIEIGYGNKKKRKSNAMFNAKLPVCKGDP